MWKPLKTRKLQKKNLFQITLAQIIENFILAQFIVQFL